jgi:peptidoglycan hydrolase CwlO-like protein
MPFEDVSQLGLAAVVALLLLRETFGFLKTQKTNGTTTPNSWAYDTNKTMSRLENEIRTLVAEIRKMNQALNNLSNLLTLQTHELKESRNETKDVQKQVRKLREEMRER